MTNLKKVLVTVLAFAMIFSLTVTANYPDVDATASYAEATDMLKYLGIMEGDDEGNFRPDADLTRAEATAIIVRAKGLESAAEGAKGATEFTDVAADHWATGYINLACQSGIVNGYGDGTFGPEDTVKYEQAVKMVVAALGYTPMAEQNGGYPSGYLVVASQNKMTNGVSGTAEVAITRANMARLVYNALDVCTMEQVSWKANEPEYAVMDGTNYTKKTLLSDALEVDTYEGYITGTYLTTATDNEDKSITVKYNKFNGETVTQNEETFFEAEGVDAASYFGQSVIVYVKENELTGDEEIIAIAAKAAKNVSLVLDYTEITAGSFVAPTTAAGSIQYVAEGTTNKITIKLDTDLQYLWNGRAENATRKEAQNFLTTPASGVVEFLDYDNDKLYDFAMVTEFTGDYVVGAVEADSHQIIDTEEAAISDIDIDNENVITRFYNADGTVATFDDVAVGDVLTLAISADSTLVTVYISKTTVNGSITEARKDKNGEDIFTIDGNDYKVSAYALTTPQVGDTGLFYVNIDNRIVDKDATSTKSENYGFLYNAVVTNGIGGATVELKFLGKDNQWVETKLAQKVYTYKGTSKDYDEAIKGIAGFIDITKTDKKDKDGKVIGTEYVADATPQLFQYELNDEGKVNKIYLADTKKSVDYFSEYAYDTEAIYRESTDRVGKTYLGEDTVVFSIATAKADLGSIDEEEDIKVAAASSIFIDNETYEYAAYDVDTTAKVVVVYAVDTKILPETQLLVIDRVAEATVEGRTVTKIYGFQSGEAVSGLVSEDGCDMFDINGDAIADFEAADLEAGDVVIFSLDADGAIDKIQLLIAVDTAASLIANNAGAPLNGNYGDDEDTWDAFGFAAKRLNGQLMLTDTKENWADTTKRDASYLKDADGVDLAFAVNANGVNVYEVALSGNSTTVEAVRASNIIVGVTKVDYDCHWAYVRTYDNEVVDVVVYRVTNEAAKEA